MAGREESGRLPDAWSVVAKDALWFAIVTRAALFLIVWLSLRAVPRLGLYPAQLPDSFLPNHPLLDGWARWDASHYIAVARFGYGDAESPSPNGGIGFFPLYPLLMRVVGFLTGQGDSNAGLAVIGLVISNLCFLAAVWLFARIATESLPGIEQARWAGRLFALAPFAFFGNAVYTESLFVLEVLGAIWFARRGKWWQAAVVAAFASATRLVGLAVIGGVLYAAWRARVRPPRLVVLAIIGASGFVAFLLYLWIRFDDALAYFETQEEWGDWNDHVWFYVKLFAQRPREALQGDPRHLVIIANVALALICIALLPVVVRRLDPATAAITTLLVLGQFAITWVSLGRYLMPAVGIYVAAAVVVFRAPDRPWLRDSILAGSATLMTGLAILYAHGFWVV
jgi:hypothetical protein